MTTAFVRSGGGSLGAVQVGMLPALGERGVEPDLLVGTSAGAIDASFVGGHGMGRDALIELAGPWQSLRRRDLFALRPLHGVLAVAGMRPSLLSAEPLRRLVEANLGYRDLLYASIELHLVTTDLSSGREVMLSSGDAASAVVASAAIPGVFPPVCREGHVLVDGGIAEHAAIRHGIGCGADEVYLLPTGFPCALGAAPTTAVRVALQALTLLSQQQLIGEVARYAGPVSMHDHEWPSGIADRPDLDRANGRRTASSPHCGGRREQGRHGQTQQEESAPEARKQADKSGDKDREGGCAGSSATCAHWQA